jgi:hypothetical protein
VSGRSHILCGRFDWDLPICCVFLSWNNGVETPGAEERARVDGGWISVWKDSDLKEIKNIRPASRKGQRKGEL